MIYQSKFDEEDERMGHKSNADTHILKRTKHISAFLPVLKLYSWRWLVVGGGHLFSVIVKDVSVLHVSVMDQSTTVHKPASSLSATQSMASDEWKFTARAHLFSLCLYNAALVCSVALRHLMGASKNPQNPANRVLGFGQCHCEAKSLLVQICSVLLNVFFFISRVSLFKMLHHNLKTQWSTALYCEGEV